MIVAFFQKYPQSFAAWRDPIKIVFRFYGKSYKNLENAYFKNIFQQFFTYLIIQWNSVT